MGTPVRRALVLAIGLVHVWMVPASGVGPSFVPDAAFSGSSLSGWQVVGRANWRAEDGEIIGSVPAGSEGWLVLDQSYQDIGLYARFRCTGGCKAGVLLRAERSEQGMTGIFVSLSDGDVGAYQVAIDTEGTLLRREPLRRAGGMIRIAPPPPPASGTTGRTGGTGRGGGRGPVPPPPGVTLPLSPPPRGLTAGDWNRVEILLDANIVRWFVNDGGATGGVVDVDAGEYGPLALYVGGPGEVRFAELAYKDLGRRILPPERVSTRFRMQRLNEFYYAWGAAAADFNRDGVSDVAAGPYIYFGPDYTTTREIYLGQTYNPSNEYPFKAWVVLAADVTRDGWPDVITSDHFAGDGVVLYVNPRNEARRWDSFSIVADVHSEIVLLRDVDRDGEIELVYAADGYIRYAEPDPDSPTGPWQIHSVSERGPWGQFPVHGLGAGDVNGDGRLDITSAWGWWEQSSSGPAATWIYHAEPFGRWTRSLPGGGTMAIYDVNGDGLNDIVTSLQAHDFGLAWFEQRRSSGGAISFVRHMIMDDYSTRNAGGVTFSQLHASTSADVDGDGVPDFIVGKRYWSHADAFFDPDPYGPPVIYWYRTVRNPAAPGGAEFVPDLIHNRSGVGSDVLATDLNQDGAADIVTSTDRGTFIFWGRRGQADERRGLNEERRPKN